MDAEQKVNKNNPKMLIQVPQLSQPDPSVSTVLTATMIAIALRLPLTLLDEPNPNAGTSF